MKKIIVAAILAIVATTPAMAQYRYYLSRTAVVYNGKIVGQDPDPSIRQDFKKNGDFYSGGQP